jgi:hypothetical protein
MLAFTMRARVRAALVGAAFLALLAAPATWAAETVGHATSGTFPAGGPASAEGGPGGGVVRGFGGGRGFGRRFGAGAFALPPGVGPGGVAGGPPPGARAGAPGGRGGPFGGAPRGGGMFGGDSAELTAALAYARSHGGGTVAVESQSTAASAILAGYDNVAGIGGFSGNESTVSAKWLAEMVKAGRLRYLLGGTSGTGSAFSDGRQGSRAAIALAEKVARKITVTYDTQTLTLYDLHGKAAALLAAGAAS